jgi:hypothetical protein
MMEAVHTSEMLFNSETTWFCILEGFIILTELSQPYKNNDK